jgi:hypothetical protein
VGEAPQQAALHPPVSATRAFTSASKEISIAYPHVAVGSMNTYLPAAVTSAMEVEDAQQPLRAGESAGGE